MKVSTFNKLTASIGCAWILIALTFWSAVFVGVTKYAFGWEWFGWFG